MADFINGDAEFHSDDAEMLDFVDSPFDLHKKFKDFLKQKSSRHSSFDYGDENNFDQSNFDRSEGSLTNTGSDADSDLSFENLSMADLVQRNKAMRRSNKLCHDKTEDLSRQLELMEEESDRNKKKISQLEKDLKCHQEAVRDRNNVLVEFGKLQEKLNKEKDITLILEEEGRRLRADEEDSIATIKSLRKQVDLLVCEIQSKNNIYEEIQADISFWKNKYTGLQEEYETCKSEFAEKFEYFDQIKEDAESCRILAERLAEDKQLLLNQYQDLKLEVSFCNKVPEEGSIGHPLLEQSCLNLHSELTQALQFGNESSNKRRSFLFEKLKSDFETMETSLDGSYCVSPLVEKSTQTLIEVSNTSNQTTEDICGVSELNEANEKCRKLEGQICSLKVENENLNCDITDVHDRMKNTNYQLKNYERKSVEILRKIRDYEEEIICLNDINCKLCSSQLSEWVKGTSLFQIQDNDAENTISKANNACKFTRLMDALNLEGFSLNRKASSISMTSTLYNTKDFDEFLRQSSLMEALEGPSVDERINTLSICKTSLQNIIVQKIADMKDIVYNTLIGVIGGLNNSANDKFSHQLTQNLSTLEILILRVSDYAHLTGVAECEEVFLNLISMFKCHIGDLEMQNYRYDREDVVVNECADSTELETCDEISPEIICLANQHFQQLKYVKMMQNVLPISICEALDEIGYSAQTMLLSFGKIRFLVLLFILCGFLSYKPLDYKVDPVF